MESRTNFENVVRLSGAISSECYTMTNKKLENLLSFTMVTKIFFTPEGKEEQVTIQEYHHIILYPKAWEKAQQLRLHKGSFVQLVGAIHYRVYYNKKGEPQKETEIIVTKPEYLKTL